MTNIYLLVEDAASILEGMHNQQAKDWMVRYLAQTRETGESTPRLVSQPQVAPVCAKVRGYGIKARVEPPSIFESEEHQQVHAGTLAALRQLGYSAKEATVQLDTALGKAIQKALQKG